ncbi:MAG: T9SS type A sorting domain-containing protein [Bacteroidota bacterium]
MPSKIFTLLCLCCLGTLRLSGQANCLDVDITTFGVSCMGMDGALQITPASGVAPYTYTINPSGQSGSFNQSVVVNDLAVGLYELSVVDSDSCARDLIFTISEPLDLLATATVTPTDCDGSPNGSITISVTGGAPPYTYEWEGGWPASSTITGLPPGPYTVTITDSNACTAEVSASTNVGNGLELELVVTDASCNGDASGAIELMSNMNLPSQIWSNGATTPSINGLSAGTYCVTVEDVDFCVQSFCATVNEPTAIDLQVDVTQPTGSNNGSAVVVASGGVPPYLYEWVGPSGTFTGNIVTGLPPGTYNLTVIDINGCTSSVFVVFEDLGVEFEITDVDCFGDATGAIDLTSFFGMPPYTYNWTGPSGFTSTEEDVSNLLAGTYFVTVTNNQGETYSQSINVLQNEPIEFLVDQFRNCGMDDYRIVLTPVGGTSPYTIDWAGGINPDQIGVGDYDFTITDALGCSSAGSVTVNATNPLAVVLDAISTACADSQDGCLTALVTGGRPPYQYAWSNGATGPTICDLTAGVYELTVVDDTGCDAVISGVVTSPDPLIVNFDATPIVCDREGTIEVLTSGGVGNYFYNWSDDPNITTANRDSLGAGTYIVTVTDDNGCTVSEVYEIVSSIELEVSSTPADCNNEGGTATAQVLGGATDPQYAWSNGAVTPTATDLATGGYSVTVTDELNGCRTHDNVIVALDSSCFVTIAGTVFLETVNQDCVADVNALGVGGILIQLNSGASTFTDATGHYAFMVPPDDYEVSMVNNNPQYNGLCTGPIAVSLPSGPASDLDNDFFVEYDVQQDLKIYVSKGNARPGFVQDIQICIWNYGAEPASGSATFVHDSLQTFLSANPTEAAYEASTRTVRWDFTNLAPGAVVIFRPRVSLPATVPLGTPLQLDFRAEPVQGDLTPWNNVLSCSMIVTGSYDPNDKQVSPAGEGDEGLVYATDTLLGYLIRFQNTGTDTAFTVVIKDTLESDLDLETVIPGPSSHEYQLSVEDERTLVFTFNDIMLPDSFVNEPASNGWVFFDIRPVASSDYGTVIDNSAAIFFDFNPPIITNTVRTTFARPLGLGDVAERELPLRVQPNPNRGVFAVEYELGRSQAVAIRLYDTQGRLVRVLQEQTERGPGTHQLNVLREGLGSGIYLLEVATAESGRAWQRVLVVD